MGLKLFKSFSKVKQWSGNEQKAIVRQLMTVITPLLIDTVPAALHCARAIFDFVTLAQYTSHTGHTLRYMAHALWRIDRLKRVFRKYRPNGTSDPDGEEDNDDCFNIPKLHAMGHFKEYIEKYGSAQNFDTCYAEAAHKFLLKDPFTRTNKNEGFETQLLRNNVLHHNMTAMIDVITMLSVKPAAMSDHQLELQITQPCRDRLDLAKYLGEPPEAAPAHFGTGGLDARYCRPAASVVEDKRLAAGDFIDALAVFIRQSRKKWDGEAGGIEDWRRREIDPSWARDHFISFHPSLTCWIYDGKDGQDISRLVKETVRCTLNWRATGKAHKDYVWISDEATRPRELCRDESLHRVIGHLESILTIYDHHRLSEKGKCLVNLHRTKNSGQVDETHGMFEVEPILTGASKRPRLLSAYRFFEMHDILRSAHIVPTGRDDTYYVNNFVDWDQYNTIYDPDFIAKGVRVAGDFAGQS